MTYESNKSAGTDAANLLKSFDDLPDSAHIAEPVVRAIVGCSHASLWRWAKAGILPQPRRFGRSTRWHVGELRAVLAK
jgi:predicted DNA-binding transcriptional regulator AlpA